MNSRDLWSIEVFGNENAKPNHEDGRRMLLTIAWRKYEEPAQLGWRAFVYIKRYLGPGRRAFDFGRYSLIVECWWVR